MDLIGYCMGFLILFAPVFIIYLFSIIEYYFVGQKNTTTFVTNDNGDTSFIDTAMWLSMESD